MIKATWDEAQANAERFAAVLVDALRGLGYETENPNPTNIRIGKPTGHPVADRVVGTRIELKPVSLPFKQQEWRGRDRLNYRMDVVRATVNQSWTHLPTGTPLALAPGAKILGWVEAGLEGSRAYWAQRTETDALQDRLSALVQAKPITKVQASIRTTDLGLVRLEVKCLPHQVEAIWTAIRDAAEGAAGHV